MKSDAGNMRDSWKQKDSVVCRDTYNTGAMRLTTKDKNPILKVAPSQWRTSFAQLDHSVLLYSVKGQWTW